MNDWENVIVGDTLQKNDVSKSNQVLSSEIMTTGKYPVIDQGQSYIAGYSDTEEKVINNGLPFIIFGDHTRIVKYVDFPFIVGADGTKVLKPAEDYHPKFYYFAILSLNIPSRGYNRHFTLLKEKSIPNPPIDIQRKIAAILSTVQNAIETQAKLIERTTELKKAMMHKLFTEGTRGEKQKMTEIGLVPEGWEVIKIDDVFEIKSSAMSYTQLEKIAEDTHGILSFGVKVSDMNIEGNEKYFHSSNLMKKLDSNSVKRTLPSNVIVFPKRGAAIATNKKRISVTNIVLDPNLIALIPNGSVVIEYFYFWLLTFDLARITDPGPTPQLNKKDLIPVKFPCPSLEEQSEIANRLSTIDSKIKLHTRKKKKMEELFRTFLHQLITAEVRVDGLDFVGLEVD